MAYPFARIELSIPLASSDGLFYGRYPHGDKPSGANLSATATDTTSAPASLKTGIPLAGAAADSSAASAIFSGVRALGFNVAGIGYESPEWPFLNILKAGGQQSGRTLVNGQGAGITAGMTSGWITVNGSGTATNEEGYLNLDPSGYVKNFTPVPAATVNYTAVKCVVVLGMSTAPGASTPYPGGSYTMQGSGAGTFSFGGADVSGCTGNGSSVSASGNTFTSTSTSGTWSVTFTVTPTSGGFTLTLNATDPLATGNYLRNLSIVETARVASYNAGAIFHPNFLAAAANFSSVRFMKWLGTEKQEFFLTFASPPTGTSGTLTGAWQGPNGQVIDVYFSSGETRACTFTLNSTTITWSGALTGTPTVNAYFTPYASSWATRSLPGDCFYSTPKGVPAEVIFALCNTLGADCHYNMPVMGFGTPTALVASKYLTPLNTLAQATLNSNLRFILGLGNETWNGGYQGMHLLYYLGFAMWPTQGPPAGWPITFTAAPGVGATSATMTVPWPFASIGSWTTFSDGSRHFLTLSNGVAGVTWSGGLGAAVTTAAVVDGNYELNRNWFGMACALIAQQCQTDWGANFSRCIPTLEAQWAGTYSFTDCMQTSMWNTFQGHSASNYASYPIKATPIAPYIGQVNGWPSQLEVNVMTAQADGGLGMFFALTTSNVVASIAFATAISAGATSAPLSSPWPYGTGAYSVNFSDGQNRTVNFTKSGSTGAWTTGLTAGVTATASLVFASQPSNGSLGQVKANILSYTAICGPGKTYPNVAVMAYEAGPNWLPGGNPPVTGYLALGIAANRDPRMGQLVHDFMVWWAANVGSTNLNTLHYFMLVDPLVYQGYGACESTMQVFSPLTAAAVSEKWRGLQKFVLGQ